MWQSINTMKSTYSTTVERGEVSTEVVISYAYEPASEGIRYYGDNCGQPPTAACLTDFVPSIELTREEIREIEGEILALESARRSAGA